MTIKELQDHIRQTTKQVNNRISEYRIGLKTAKYPFVDPVFEKGIKELQRTSKQTKKGDIIYTNFKGKRKKELERQLKRLNRFLDSLDTTTETSIEKIENDTISRYNAFQANPDNPSLSYEDYKNLMDDLDSIGSDILGTFNYGAMMEYYADIVEDGKTVDLVSAINRVRSKKESKGISRDAFTQMVIDDLRQQINRGKK